MTRQNPIPPLVQEMDCRDTVLGEALYIRIYTPDYRQLTWDEVWATFIDRYPDQWAVQVFPPADQVVNEENLYHLFVLADEPRGLNIKRRDSASTCPWPSPRCSTTAP